MIFGRDHEDIEIIQFRGHEDFELTFVLVLLYTDTMNFVTTFKTKERIYDVH